MGIHVSNFDLRIIKHDHMEFIIRQESPLGILTGHSDPPHP